MRESDIIRMRVNFVPRGLKSVLIGFQNETGEAVRLAKSRIAWDVLDGNYFLFDAPATYLGVTAKRKPYTNDEVIILQPRDCLYSILDLGSTYRFPEGSPKQMRYKADHQTVTGKVTTVDSGWVTLW